MSVSTRVTALRTPAWSGHPALWAQRAEGRRSSTTTTSLSAPSSQRISTPSRSSWSTRNTKLQQLQLSPGAPSFWLWCRLKKWNTVRYEVWNIKEAETAVSQHIQVLNKPFNVCDLFVYTLHSQWVFLQCTHSFLSLLWLQSVRSQLWYHTPALIQHTFVSTS